ncbi:MAG: hypothetical protein ACR2G4_00715 [Pyrinomonadaceae bacterium]
MVVIVGRAEDLPGVLLLIGAGGFAFTGLAVAVCLIFAAAPALFLADFAGAVVTALLLAAFCTGAFSAPERLASGFGLAVFAFNLRFFAGDTPEALRVAGREAGLFALLLMDSLMRNSRNIKMTPEELGAGKRPKLNTACRINQRGSVSCGRTAAFG